MKYSVEIELTDDEFKFISEYAAENKINLSKLFLESALEKISNETISDADLLKISDEIISQRQKVYEALAK